MNFKLLFLLLFISTTAFSAPQRLNLSDAIKMNVVTVSATAKGGYTGQALNIKVTNKSGNTLLITVDPAVLFRPEDTTQQDLVLVGNEKLSIQPFKDAATDVQTFCAKSYGHAPKAGESFSFLKKGSDTLENLILFMRQNNLLFSPLAQKAIWVITNQHAISSVYEPSLDLQSRKLAGYLSSVTGQQEPDLFQAHALRTEQDVPVFDPKVLHIIGSFEEKLEAPKKLMLGVYNQSNELIQPVFENRMFGKGGHRFKVDFEAKNVAAGTYFIRLKEGDNLLQEKKVVVE